MNQADTAWMLISTALVLLMTPALAFFYGGLVRSKNALNTMMMSFISLGIRRRRCGRSSATRWRSRRATTGSATCRGCSCTASASRRRARSRTCSSCATRARSHHHGGADLRRHRRAHALLRLRGLHLALGARRLQPGRALGLGRRLARQDGRARLRRRHRRPRERRRRRARRRDRRRPAPRLSRRSSLLPHNVPFTLLGAGLLWFGWFGFNAGSALAANGIAALAFTTTMLAPAATLVVWTLLDVDASRQADGRRRRHRDRRRPRRDHAGGRIRRPDERDRARRDRGVPELLRAALAREDHRSTIRSTSSPRTASAARSARC